MKQTTKKRTKFVTCVFILTFLFSAVIKIRANDPQAQLDAALNSMSTEETTANIVVTEQASGHILILKPNCDWNNPESIVWAWEPEKSPEIAAEHRGWFHNFSDAKPVHGTDQLLTVASGGGVALVNLSDSKVLFYVLAGGNTHSAALLPDGNLATASSTGNYLRLFIMPETFLGPDSVPFIEYPFTDAHGLVWDNIHQILWALGGKELKGFTYTGTKEKPALEQVYETNLPEDLISGHDLYPIPDSQTLFVTGRSGVGLFDTDARTLTLWRKTPHLKSISLDTTGHIIVQKPSEEWWNESIQQFNKQGFQPIGTLSGAKFYKARWWIPDSMQNQTADKSTADKQK